MSEEYGLGYGNLFKLEIPESSLWQIPESLSDELRSITYFIQSLDLPSVSMMPIEDFFMNNQVKMPGNTVDYETLRVEFLMDENFSNYLTLHNWLASFRDDDIWNRLTRDIKLSITNPNKNRVVEFTYVHAYPIMIESINLNSAVSEPDPITFGVTFAYQYFVPSKVTANVSY